MAKRNKDKPINKLLFTRTFIDRQRFNAKDKLYERILSAAKH